MTDLLVSLIKRHRRTGIVLDTNILLLLVVGEYDPDLIPRFKRTRQFAQEDFKTLVRLLAYFRVRLTTPTILAEVNSLANQLAEPARGKCLIKFAAGIAVLAEHYEPSASLAALPMFGRFGLTDGAIMRLAEQKLLVLTDDFRLAQYLSSAGVDVINFNHVRVAAWA